jgi:hypothetical protein
MQQTVHEYVQGNKAHLLQLVMLVRHFEGRQTVMLLHPVHAHLSGHTCLGNTGAVSLHDRCCLLVTILLTLFIIKYIIICITNCA